MLEVALTWCCLSSHIPVGSVVISTVTAEDSHFTGETKWVKKSCCLTEILCHIDLFKRDFKKRRYTLPTKTCCRSSPEKLSGPWEYRGAVVTT